ncbi:hypothetical protein [uncultured Shewanella sp.]|uniref:hypothetical protein n=1 Tax=uncultured Shewanella sp. TaxID=173975 RepID=UPI0026075343|nr:hypothetical protein [uncultured Shewanella sp.]
MHSTRRLRKGAQLFLFFINILLMQACMVVPNPVSAPVPRPATTLPQYAVCNTATHQWELQTQELGSLKACQYSNQLSGICMATFGLIVPLGSFIVSGSVYLIGNTLHWLEYQGRCDDGFVQRGLALFDGGSVEMDLNENETDLMEKIIDFEENTVEHTQ